MDYVKPQEVIASMLAYGRDKAALPLRDMLIRGFLSGAILGFATSLALTAAQQTVPIVGALVFPVGFCMIVLLGLELVTGSFALVSVAAVDGGTSWRRGLRSLFWVYTANLAGAVFYAGVLTFALKGHGAAVIQGIIAVAEAKTIAYSPDGVHGLLACFSKAMLCNWMVCMAVVLALTSRSTVGKIVAAWLPVLTFFGQAFEHCVVNMFVIPAGMLLGAKVTFTDWWFWNMLPATLGNFVGGFVFVGLFLYWTYGPRAAGAKEPAVVILRSPAESDPRKSAEPSHGSPRTAAALR